MNTIRVSKRFWIQNVQPDLGPIRLQRLTADNTSRQRDIRSRLHKHFEARSGLTESQACSGFKLFAKVITRPRRGVGNMSGYRCMSDCRSRGCEFDTGPYFCGDWSWNKFYGHSPPLYWIIQEELLSLTRESSKQNKIKGYQQTYLAGRELRQIIRMESSWLSNDHLVH